MEPLNNPIWMGLTTSQARFAETCGLARRFPPEVTLLGAFPAPSRGAYESLACLVKGPEVVALFLPAAPDVSAGWKVLEVVPLCQMVCEKFVRPAARAEFFELGETDVPQMMKLAELTKPGPFGRRTRELGRYIGVRQDGRLAAMAGERIQFPGYTEVSAVCTHPDFAGRGFAAALMTVLIDGILERGEVPFLHVRASNERAIGIYRRMGFRERVTYQLAVLRKAA
jgi:ribosomal protein S18 acetylase RimI-like enzyme